MTREKHENMGVPAGWGMGWPEAKDREGARATAQAQGSESLVANEQAGAVQVLEEVNLNSRQRYRKRYRAARMELYKHPEWLHESYWH